jgi:oxygen-independent coproporphyrinogen-3 oxidase
MFQSWLRELPPDEPLSLYLHIPFCSSLCWFCGCHMSVVNSYGPVAAYVELLLRELDMAAESLGARHPVTHIHFGGGSPTILRAGDIARLNERLRTLFHVPPEAEFAVEIDPRGLTYPTVEAFAHAGVNRASIGVQDVNPNVQRAINRWQPMDVTRSAAARLRGAGIAALNLDLIYGLPYQTADDVRRTIDACLTLQPQRFSVFGYAHVPEMKRHQQLIDASALPDADERLRQYDAACASLIASGYQPVGLDHFALPGDPLAAAQREGRLARNFQGYTTDGARALIGVGASAISCLPQGYAQNANAVPDYRARILRGELAAVRGHALSRDDRLRRDIIERLMCDLEVDLQAIALRHGVKADGFAPELHALEPLRALGMVEIDANRLTVPVTKRAAVRLVSAVFDAYLDHGSARHAVAV